jgi:hypothetical protein
MGIVEGITEWLPISSTGHMILLEQIIKFNASEEFMSMFRVVIQLGAIMAVVVLFWGKLWPFGLRHGRVISKPSVWQLWFKVVAATLPVLVISPLDDWMEEHFYNYITVAAMLILLALGVSRADALADYMLTNVYRREIIERFLADKPAAERDLLLPVEGVSEPMGAGAIDEILRRYPSYEAYFADEFGLDAARLKALRDFYLE